MLRKADMHNWLVLMGYRNIYLAKFGQIIFAFALLAGVTLTGQIPVSYVSAQTTSPTPLETDPTDPLLPQNTENRALTARERQRLATALDELNAQATAEFAAGNQDEAFVLWYREIRLRRVLGKVEEVRALGKVGAIAWQESRNLDVQLISKRLREIEQQAELEAVEVAIDPELLTALGQAYEQLRVPERAINIYEQILADAKEKGDLNTQYAALNTLGSLHISWFSYDRAADAYQELLLLTQEQADQVNESFYLEQLAFIYDKNFQPTEAVPIKEKLVEKYLAQQQSAQLINMHISLADDYSAIAKPEAASQSYQEAFKLAWSVQNLASAHEALDKLAQLYHTNEQPTFAVQIYQELLNLEQQSYDFYGQINTYDKIGEIHLEQENYPLALQAFTSGLQIANSLGYREDYFERKITNIQESSRQ